MFIYGVAELERLTLEISCYLLKIFNKQVEDKVLARGLEKEALRSTGPSCYFKGTQTSTLVKGLGSKGLSLFFEGKMLQ